MTENPVAISDPLVAILIPVYRDSLDSFGIASLSQCFKNWGNKYDIYFVKPKSLALTKTQKLFVTSKIAEYEDSYFTSISGYCRLMMATEFYERFLDYKYIFIYQTDGYAFRDELQYWCEKDYDYLGAPWIPKDSYKRFYNRAFVYLRKALNNFLDKPDRSMQYYQVGNGGVSLRKTSVFHGITKTDSANIERYISNLGKSSMYNEDIYWSLAPKLFDNLSVKQKQLSKPGYKEALGFSFDMNPSVCYRLNNNQLPFCCHSFSKPKFWKFWKNHIPTMVSN